MALSTCSLLPPILLSCSLRHTVLMVRPPMRLLLPILLACSLSGAPVVAGLPPSWLAP